MLFYNVSHSGCLLYPITITCPDEFFWGLGKEKVSGYMTWYELWSKAGATPTYRVENIEEYDLDQRNPNREKEKSLESPDKILNDIVQNNKELSELFIKMKN